MKSESDKSENILKNASEILGLKPGSGRVLELLAESGVLSASDIATALNMPKPSVYDAVAELLDKSLVIEYMEGKAKQFGISSPDQLEEVFKKKIGEFNTAHETLISFIKSHANSADNAHIKPRIRFYNGVEGIRQAFRDIPWVPEYQETFLMWPVKDMLDTLGEAFLKQHALNHIKYKVLLKVIRKDTDRAHVPHVAVSNSGSNEEWLNHDPESTYNDVRYAPKGMDWSISYWIYADKVLFAGSGKEKYAFVVQSREFAQLMKLMWNQMWSVSVA